MAAAFACGWILARKVDAAHAAELWRVRDGLAPVTPESYGDGEPEESS